ncbi:serine protease 42-like isoform X2 [Pollicipes pollicipes]|uniref:serine protease 42-like isoform X2 n=1 Tax=Pollicipes pollicipes TaxID=41117 RepID=UPI0018857673|nr:serine protease 42-like isoform X2 [Pollicipes pollicipes]
MHVMTPLLTCCLCMALWTLTAAEGEACVVDAAGTSGECRRLIRCQPLHKLYLARKAGTAGPEAVTKLRALAAKCPPAAPRRLLVCCQNEVTGGLTTPAPYRSAVSSASALLPTEDVCGKSFSGMRVIGGVDAEIAQFPWMASVQAVTESLTSHTPSPSLWCPKRFPPGRERPSPTRSWTPHADQSINRAGPSNTKENIGKCQDSERRHICGATLITSRHVLTAAHCVVFLSNPAVQPVSVILGELDFDSEIDCSKEFPDECADPPIEVEISAIFFHPEFQNIKQLALPRDIAIVQLAEEVTFTDFIRPICVLTDLSVLEGTTDIAPDGQAVVAGWGRSEIDSQNDFTAILQTTTLPVRALASCERDFNFEDLGLEGRICAGAGPNSSDACRGDSGGPLMMPVLARYCNMQPILRFIQQLSFLIGSNSATGRQMVPNGHFVVRHEGMWQARMLHQSPGLHRLDTGTASHALKGHPASRLHYLQRGCASFPKMCGVSRKGKFPTLSKRKVR